MNKSKYILGLVISISLIGFSCDSKFNVPETQENTDTSDKKTDDLKTVASPKPENTTGNEEVPPEEPEPIEIEPPFIVGKTPADSFGGNGSDSGDEDEEKTVKIVPAKISGQVFGYNVNSKNFTPLANALVVIGEKIIETDTGGYYTSEDEIDDFVSVSASAKGYVGSTVASVSPGAKRDIHLQPVDSVKTFNTNTISFEYESLGEDSPEPVAKKYPRVLSFASNDNFRFINTLIDEELGNYKVEINPVAERTSVSGYLLEYDIERNGKGQPTNPTQMKGYKLHKSIIFRVGDTTFPETTTFVEETVATQADLINKFTSINTDFRSNASFSSFVCNAYIVFPTGEKLLASKYIGDKPTKISFRLPRLANTTYTIEAHAGNASIGSDVVINNLQESESVVAYLLSPPARITPSYSSSISTSPSLSWSKVNEARAYQVDIEQTSDSDFHWEGYTTDTKITYPAGLDSLPSASQLKYQVIAMDFNRGGLNILSNSQEDLRAVKNDNSDLPFKIMLNNHRGDLLPKGYRVSYREALFRTE